MTMSSRDAGASDAVAVLYTNYRGETAVRRIVVRSLHPMWFGATAWHTDPQWHFSALDLDKGQPRDFALSGVKAWGQEAVDAALSPPAVPVPDQRSAWARAAETVGADKPWWWDKPWADLGYGSRGDVQAWFQGRDPLRRAVEPDGPDLYVRLHCDPRPHMLDAAPAPADAPTPEHPSLLARLERERARLFAPHESGRGYRYGDDGYVAVGLTNAEARSILAGQRIEGRALALEAVASAAWAMPLETPAPGGAGTFHSFEIEAGVVWSLGAALKKLDAAPAPAGATEDGWRTRAADEVDQIADLWSGDGRAYAKTIAAMLRAEELAPPAEGA